jgi:hypothetical protein
MERFSCFTMALNSGLLPAHAGERAGLSKENKGRATRVGKGCPRGL